MPRAFLFGLNLILCLFSLSSNAHQLAPARLSMTQLDENSLSIEWKESRKRPSKTQVAPQFPSDCTKLGKTDLISLENAFLYRWTLHCQQNLANMTIYFHDLDKAKTNVLVTYTNTQQRQSSALISSHNNIFIIPENLSLWRIFQSYTLSGIEHLIFGWDHVAFVLALFALLWRSQKTLLIAITTFTVGHSFTLLLASIGFLPFNVQWIEILIALSITLLAAELCVPDTSVMAWSVRKRPYLLTTTFGLIHGCGFASVLQQSLSKEGSILLPLMAFNLGIEMGQLILISVLFLTVMLFRHKKVAKALELLPLDNAKSTMFLAYMLGTLSCYWFFMRL